MRKIIVTTLLLILSLNACSSKEPFLGESSTEIVTESGVKISEQDARSLTKEGNLAGYESQIAEVSADVIGVDIVTRKLTLKVDGGKITKVTAGPAVRNLAQVKPGDRVKLTYIQAMDFQVRQPTADEVEAAKGAVAVVGRAPLGAKPAGVLGAGVTKIVTIQSVDKANSTVIVNDGNSLLTVKAKYPQNLELIKRGDTVVVTYAEMLAANIEPIS